MSQVRTLLQEPIGVSPSGKATDSDSVIRRFESCYPCQVDPLAQSVEHLTFNQGVPRSSRGWITICGLFVKWLRHRPFTAGSGGRIPHRSPSGRLAQLGERLPYKQNVGSSILSSPTKAKSSLSGCFLHIKDKNSIFLYWWHISPAYCVFNLLIACQKRSSGKIM